MKNKIDNRYRILNEIGRGSGGCVYLVYDEKLERNWAMKELKVYNKQEIETLKMIDYPAFPRIVDLIETRTSHFLIMDYIDGLTLREYIQTCRVSEQSIKEWAIQIALALSYLHDLNPPIYYLDCKPDNIVISSNNMIHIIDLGSTYVECKHDTLQRISGTPHYAPLEQKSPDLNSYSISAQCDIYSLGVTLFYAFTQTEQILRDGKERLLVRNFNTAVSLGMNKIIDRCTRINRKQRFHSMKEVISALQKLDRITEKERRKHFFSMVLRFIARGIIIFTILKFGIDYQRTQNKNYLFLLFTSLLFFYFILKNKKQNNYEIKKEIIRGEGKKFLYFILIIILQNQMFATAQNKELKLNLLIKDSVNRNILIKENGVWDVKEDIKLVIPFYELPEGKNKITVICTNQENSNQKSYEFTYDKDKIENTN